VTQLSVYIFIAATFFDQQVIIGLNTFVS